MDRRLSRQWIAALQTTFQDSRVNDRDSTVLSFRISAGQSREMGTGDRRSSQRAFAPAARKAQPRRNSIDSQLHRSQARSLASCKPTQRECRHVLTFAALRRKNDPDLTSAMPAATMTRSIVSDWMPLFSAGATPYSTRSCCWAFAICFSLASVAITRSNTAAQSNCRLSVSRGAIPRELTTWRDASQINEQLLRVTWSKDRVISSLFRKMIFERHTSLRFAAARLGEPLPLIHVIIGPLSFRGESRNLSLLGLVFSPIISSLRWVRPSFGRGPLSRVPSFGTIMTSSLHVVYSPKA